MTSRSTTSRTSKTICFYLSVIILFSSFLLHFSEIAAATNKEFPLYPAIKNNVRFWEKIYSTYSLNQAVIHDSNDLSKVYSVINLVDKVLPGAERINSSAEKKARKKFSTILKKLSKRKPTSKEEIRIAALFRGKNGKKRMARAAENVRSQKGQKERFLSGVIRSGAYLQEIKRIFRTYRLPEELAYLPHVESSFNTKAYSKFGASGIWQITRSTGKQYLTIDYTIDERLDPILATHAAAKYLKNSYNILGKWPLAITSYNYGTSGMMRAMKAEGSYEQIFKNYNKGHFKFASKNFYSEFLAALNVVKNLEQNSSVKLASPQSNKYFKLPNYIHINNIAKHFDISTATLKDLNPALRAPVFKGEKLIPKDYKLRLHASQKTNRHIDSISPSLFKNKQKASRFHRVKKGDTASTIAKLHKVSLKSLVDANHLDKVATIYLRQKLRIPTKTAKYTSASEDGLPLLQARQKMKSETFQSATYIPVLLANKKNRPLETISDAIPHQDPTVYNVINKHTKKDTLYGYVTVQPEESIVQYAKWLDVPPTKIAVLNNLKTDTYIEPGKSLLLPFERLSPEFFEDKRLDFLQETEEDFFSAYKVVGKKKYRVLSGDTLWDLCYNKFDIPLWLLERYNSTMNLAQLTTAQELVIPIVQSI